MCNLFTYDENNIYNNPLHFGIIISTENNLIKEQIELLLKWSASFIRNKEYLNSRNIVLFFIVLLLNRFIIIMNVH